MPATLLTDTHPEIASEWHPTRNAGIDLATLGTFSNRKVWWLHVDARGDVHEWQQIIRNRAYDGSGCGTCRSRGSHRPAAAFKPPTPGRSLADRMPEIARQWNHERNTWISPSQVTLRSTRHVWWRCENGHEWVRTVGSQVAVAQSHRGPCSECAAQVPKPNTRTLAEASPVVAAEWHATRNGALTPADVSSHASIKVWWTGACGHAWKATVRSRHADGSGCSKCRGAGAAERFAAWKSNAATSLAHRAPVIAEEWHPTKNGTLTPADVSYGSGKRVWWRCAAGHEWENTVNSRTGRNRGCWCCANPSRVPVPEAVSSPQDSLAATDRDVAGQWHPTRNGLATPDSINGRSDQRAWWRCTEGHEWQSKVSSRAGSEHGCRACANTAERLARAA